jgi:hypothetical protein
MVAKQYRTHDFLMLRARFHSLFLWPALMAATELPEIPDLSKPPILTKMRKVPAKRITVRMDEEGKIKYKRRV